MRRYAPHSRTSTDRALARIGDEYPTGWCLRFAATDVLGVPGAHTADYTKPDPDCLDFWEAAKSLGQVIETDNPAKIPAGVLAIWAGGPHGHAAFTLAGGDAVGTDYPDLGHIGRFPIADLGSAWGYELLGAVLVDGNGYLYEPRPDDYRPTFKVTAAGGARGYARPDTSAAPGKKLRKGSKVDATLVQVRFKIWADVGGTFYRFEDLERVS
jgi:hypothetical protein